MLLETLGKSSQIHAIVYQYTCRAQLSNLSSTHQPKKSQNYNDVGTWCASSSLFLVVQEVQKHRLRMIKNKLIEIESNVQDYT